MIVCISTTDPLLLPDPKKLGPDPNNPYRLYLQKPEVRKEPDGRLIKFVRPFMDIFCPVYGGCVGYYDLTRGVSHFNCVGDAVIDAKTKKLRFVPQQLGSSFAGINNELKASALLQPGY